jgi:uncharacterized RDD family membrane protein YckC
MVATNECQFCHQSRGEGRFCQFCGVFALDTQGTVVMASRLSRLGAWLVNAVLMVLLLFIGWVIWWFIVAPRGQNPGKALVGLRVIKTNGEAARTGTMFVRGLVSAILGYAIPVVPLDSAWLLWDRDAQTLHDKLVETVVVKAAGSERIVEQGSLGTPPPGVEMPPAFAPPVTLPATPPPASAPPSGAPPASAAPAEGSPEAELTRLAHLREQELITQDEYEAKRKEILDRM